MNQATIGATSRIRVLVAVLVVMPLAVYHQHLTMPLSPDAVLLTRGPTAQRTQDSAWSADFFGQAGDERFGYETGYYRPVTNQLYAAAHRVAGDDPRLYNALQMGLHGLNAAVLLLLLVSLGLAPAGAAAAALLFAVHPVHAYAATEPAALADVLFPFFYLLGVLAFDRGLVAKSRARTVALVAVSCLMYALALLSKETGITLPAALAAVLLFRHARGSVPLRALRWTLPAWGMLGAYAILRVTFLDVAMQDFGFVERHGLVTVAAAQVVSVLVHLSRIVLPLGATYPELNPWLVNRLGPPLTDPLFWLGLACGAAIVVAAFQWKKSSWVALWATFFLVTFSPLVLVDHIAGALNPDVIPTEERWIYLPSVAVFALGGLAVSRALDRLGDRRALGAAAFALLVVALGWTAHRHAGRYFDPFAQLQKLYVYPEEDLGRRELANRLLLYAEWVALPRGEVADAERRARRAYALVDDSPIPAAGLAEILARRGRWSEVSAVIERWYPPDRTTLRAAETTNAEVYVDLYRVAARLAFLQGSALGHRGAPLQAAPYLCEAVRRGVPLASIERMIASWPVAAPYSASRVCGPADGSAPG